MVKPQGNWTRYIGAFLKDTMTRHYVQHIFALLQALADLPRRTQAPQLRYVLLQDAVHGPPAHGDLHRQEKHELGEVGQLAVGADGASLCRPLGMLGFPLVSELVAELPLAVQPFTSLGLPF